MASYNLEAIQEKLAEIQNGGRPKKKTSSKSKGPTFPFWRPPLGDSQIRFLPFDDGNGSPFYTVGYYANELLIGDGWRQVAPGQFGEEDPIFNLLSKLSQKRQPTEVFKMMNALRPKDSFYAPILVRGEEDKGAQVWELSSNRAKEIFAILAHPDYVEDDLFDEKTGLDFLISVSETDKTYKGNVVKDVSISERKKTSPLAKTQAAIDEIMASIPDFEAYFRGKLRPTEAYEQMLENAMAGSVLGGDSGESKSEEDIDFGASRNAAKSDQSKSIDDAFADI